MRRKGACIAEAGNSKTGLVATGDAPSVKARHKHLQIIAERLQLVAISPHGKLRMVQVPLCTKNQHMKGIEVQKTTSLFHKTCPKARKASASFWYIWPTWRSSEASFPCMPAACGMIQTLVQLHPSTLTLLLTEQV